MKRIRKFTPVSMYDAQGLESWLEDMAKQGLFLKKFGAVWCVFERGPAQALRYRVEPVREQDCGDFLGRSPMKELYQDFGWSYTASIGNSMFIFSTEDENAPELHTDPELQSGLWKKLYRQARRSFRFQLLLTVILAAALCAQLWNGGFIHSLITSTTPIMLLCLPLLLFQLPGDWAELQKLALMVKQLEAGVPLDHRTFYPKRNRREAASLVLAVILLLGMFAVQYILPFTGGGIRPLADQTAFPALTLEELEGQELEDLVRTLADYGLDAIECYYPKHTPEQQAFCLRLTEKYRLHATGGSDFHGERVKPDIPLSALLLDVEWLVTRPLNAG